MPWLINPTQLDKFRKNQKNVVIVDASWYMASDGRDARYEYLNKHIVGARFLDFNLFHDTHTDLPNMLIRDEELIRHRIGELGITNDHKIIFYDNSPWHSSCRALWMFKVFGHNPNLLYVLDGNIDAWEQYGGKFDLGETKAIATKKYSINFEAHLIRTLLQMKTNLHHPQEQVIDVRHPVRFAGGPEVRPGLRSGHIPGSYSFPFFTLFEADGRWKSIDKIRKQLYGLGINMDFPIVSMCGSGMTAAILNFTLDLLGIPESYLYDGSWTEWGSSELYQGEENLSERPIVTCLD